MIPSLLFSPGGGYHELTSPRQGAHAHMATGSMRIHAGNQRVLMHI